MELGKEFSKEAVDNLFNFTMDMGRNYTGTWVTDTVFRITLIDPWVPVTRFWCTPKASCNQRCDKCEPVTNPLACIRTLPDSTIPDAILNTGSDDCPSCPSPRVNATDPGYLINEGTPECPNCPSPRFNWVVRGICTYSDDGNYRPPEIGTDLIRVKYSANLRESPPVDLPTFGIDYTGIYPPAPLSGDFGPSDVNISSLVGGGGSQKDSVFGDMDTITVVFTVDTNMAGYGIGSNLTKEQVDALLDFSSVIGSHYNGTWLDRRRLLVTVIDSTDNSLPALGVMFVTTRKEGWLRNYPAVSGQNSFSIASKT